MLKALLGLGAAFIHITRRLDRQGGFANPAHPMHRHQTVALAVQHGDGFLQIIAAPHKQTGRGGQHTRGLRHLFGPPLPAQSVCQNGLLVVGIGRQ